MKKLTKYLSDLEGKIEQQQLVNTAVSQGAVGWHIEHSLLVINGIVETLKNSDPSKYKWKFNFPRLITYTTGAFPRGRARAPKSVTPREYDSESLKKHLQNTFAKIKELDTMPKDKFMTHPFFGDIRTNDTIKFLEIHTYHHLKIMNDIKMKI